MKEKRQIVELDASLTRRSVNEGFSGGERKRNEIFQMAMLEPPVAILDETDSGLDVDALRVVAEGFNKIRTADFVHVLMNGRIVRSGDAQLGYRIEREGFDWIKAELHEEL